MKKYEHLYRRIQADITSGILKQGERLPSIRDEAQASGVSVNTVINAYNILSDEGLIPGQTHVTLEHFLIYNGFKRLWH